MATYEQMENRILRLLEEAEDEVYDNSDSEENDECEELVHNSDSETDSEENFVDQDLTQSETEESFFIGRDKKTRWMKNAPPTNIRTRRQNIVTRLPGVRGVAKCAKSALECFLLFIDDDIIRKITTYTNLYIGKIAPNFNRERNAKQTDNTEIK